MTSEERFEAWWSNYAGMTKKDHVESAWQEQDRHYEARIKELEAELAEWRNGERQYPPAVADAQDRSREIVALKHDIAALKGDQEPTPPRPSEAPGAP